MIVDEKCVASSTSCTLHVALQTEEASTKDDDAEFATVNPTGLSWDVSVDALVTDNNLISGEVITDTSIANEDYPYSSLTPINLRDGDILNVQRAVPANQTALCLITADVEEELATAAAGHDISFTADEDMTVYIASDTDGEGVIYYVVDAAQNATSLIEATGTKVTLEFSTMGGIRNREEETPVLEGEAFITDFSLTATNRQNSVYTVQFTGTGDLSFV